MWISIDGDDLSKLRDTGYVSVVLPAGRYDVEAEQDAWGNPPSTERRIHLNVGRATFCAYWVEDPQLFPPVPKAQKTELQCSEDEDAHADLRRCRREPALEGPLWKP